MEVKAVKLFARLDPNYESKTNKVGTMIHYVRGKTVRFCISGPTPSVW